MVKTHRKKQQTVSTLHCKDYPKYSTIPAFLDKEEN